MLTQKVTVDGAVSRLLLFVLFFLAACGGHGVQDASTTGSDWNTNTTAVQPIPLAPPRPQGKVPSPLVGVWSGGEGSKSGYRLTFFSNSTYELIHERSTAIPAFREVGYCVGGNSSLLLRSVKVEGPVERSERTARWGIQPSSVIDVLTVIDPLEGESSYVRIG